MEKRLENAFAEAESKVLNSNSRYAYRSPIHGPGTLMKPYPWARYAYQALSMGQVRLSSPIHGPGTLMKPYPWARYTYQALSMGQAHSSSPIHGPGTAMRPCLITHEQHCQAEEMIAQQKLTHRFHPHLSF